MSKKHRISENTQALFRDFYSAYCRNKTLNPGLSKRRLLNMTINQPAPEWYVSYRTALRELRIVGIAREDYAGRRLFIDLAARMREARLTDSRSFSKVLSDILCSEAPRFYISTRLAYNIVNQKEKL